MYFALEEPDAFWAEQENSFISFFAKWDRVSSKNRIVILRLQKFGLKEQSSMYVISW